ncbi:MAG: Y-family DNA polymerase [Muribaculaceae bacterium]|nr:Y-family DNA polymerase [Muribaculaceae bacterium]MDE7142157.1 Y-family DNA polymerase [Muribaculaceae bacterium]
MWAVVDCDNFFCSCERVFRPELNGRPVVVLSNNDGCVIARSREAKEMGVKMGLPYYQMLQQFPASGITAFSSNYELYGDMSARVMSVLRMEAPSVRQYSIDEAFLDLAGMEHFDLKAWGEQLALKIRRWTGIPVSIGIGATKTLAKVASRFAKTYPGYRKCCMIATEEQRLTALGLFEVGEVWGIGRKLVKSLAAYGIVTALELTRRSRGWVRSKYGVTGERTWTELRGGNAIELDDLDTKKNSITTSRSFPEMVSDPGELRTHIANYAARCAAKLRMQRSVCSKVSVFVQSNHFRDDLRQYDNFTSYTFTTPTNTTTEIVSAAQCVLSAIFRSGIRYKRAGVMVSEISSDEAVQPDLFEFDPDMARRYRSVSEAIDEINRRLGADTVVLAAQQYSGKGADGKNVKFSGAIRRTLKSPDYSTNPSDFPVK